MLALLNQEPGYETIQKYLNEAQRGERDVLMNAINVGEVSYIVHRQRGATAAEHFLRLLRVTAVMVQVPTFDDILAAAGVKARYPISYADAFAVATALKEGIPVVTGDPEFRRVEEIVTVEWI